VSPIVFYPGVFAGYFVTNWLHSLISNVLYGSRNVSDMMNAELFLEPVSSIFTKLLSFKQIIDTVISNTTNLIIYSYGLAAIVIIILSYAVINIIHKVIIKRNRDDSNLILPRDQMAVFLILAGCIIASLIGIYLRWSYHIDKFYIGEGSVSKVFVFTRYFFSYLSPLILIFASYAYYNIDKMKKTITLSFILFSSLYVYYIGRIVPMVQHTYDFQRPDAFAFFLALFTMFGAVGTFFVIGLFFLIFYLLVHKRKPLLIVPFICVLLLFNSFRSIYNAPLKIGAVAPHESLDIIYSVIKNMESTVETPDVIHAGTQNNMVLQFMLNRYRVVSYLPIDENGDAIFIGPASGEHTNELRDLGFMLYQFPDDVDIWIRGDRLRENIILYAVEYSNQHDVFIPQVYFPITSEAKSVFIPIEMMHTVNGRVDGNSIIASGEPGIVAYGPYIKIPRGMYIAELDIIVKNEYDGSHVMVDVAINAAEHISEASFTPHEFTNGVLNVKLPFYLVEDGNVVEVRVYAEDEVVFVIENIRISPDKSTD